MLALTKANLIDGTGRPPLPGSTVVIDKGVFTAVGREVKYPAEAEVIDLHGLTIMPGLIDCHVHLGGLTVDRPGKAIGKVSLGDMASFSGTTRATTLVEDGWQSKTA